MKRSLRLGLVCLLAPLAAAALSADDSRPGRDPAQPIDEAYTKKIREYTTEPFFLSPLVDYLPAVAGRPDAAGRPRRRRRARRASSPTPPRSTATSAMLAAAIAARAACARSARPRRGAR